MSASGSPYVTRVPPATWDAMASDEPETAPELARALRVAQDYQATFPDGIEVMERCARFMQDTFVWDQDGRRIR